MAYKAIESILTFPQDKASRVFPATRDCFKGAFGEDIKLAADFLATLGFAEVMLEDGELVCPQND